MRQLFVTRSYQLSFQLKINQCRAIKQIIILYIFFLYVKNNGFINKANKQKHLSKELKRRIISLSEDGSYNYTHIAESCGVTVRKCVRFIQNENYI